MTKANNKARKHRSAMVARLLNETTAVEKMQIGTKMAIAARLDDLITTRGWGRGEFAEKVTKNPSEISKWLSGTHNFTIDMLAEIAVAFDRSVAELLTHAFLPLIDSASLQGTSE